MTFQAKKTAAENLMNQALHYTSCCPRLCSLLPLPITYSTQGQHNYVLVKEFSKSVHYFRTLAPIYKLTNKCCVFIILVLIDKY